MEELLSAPEETPPPPEETPPEAQTEPDENTAQAETAEGSAAEPQQPDDDMTEPHTGSEPEDPQQGSGTGDGTEAAEPRENTESEAEQTEPPRPTEEPEAGTGTETTEPEEETGEGDGGEGDGGDGPGTDDPGGEETGETGHGGEEADDDTPDEPEEKEPEDEPAEKPEPGIRTNLRTERLTAGEEDSETYPLHFSGEIVNGEENMSLCVFFRSTAPDGSYLDSGTLEGDGDYEMELCEGTHTFTFRVRQDGTLLPEPQETRIVTWSCNHNPPTIYASLGQTGLSDGCCVETETQEPLLMVSAIDEHGNPVARSDLNVWLDGVLQHTSPTGSGRKEYKLWLEAPEEGDEARHIVIVEARDSLGQTATESYTIAFRPITEGGVIGHATVYFDCTTVGLDVLDPDGVEVELRQGYPASYVLMDALTAYGWDCTYSGGLGGPEDRIGGFYLKSIIGPDFSQANPSRWVPELWSCIQNDGLEIDRSLKPSGALANGEELGEFDFTNGSGWMYEVNGYYPGRGFSEYYPQDGDVFTLRFTLSFGKDIGEGQSERGRFDSYCHVWLDGVMYPEEHPESWYELTETPATCTEDGARVKTCPCCGDSVTETIPATGHEFHEGICIHCGETDPEWSVPGEDTPGEDTPSEDTPGGEEQPEETEHGDEVPTDEETPAEEQNEEPREENAE